MAATEGSLRYGRAVVVTCAAAVNAAVMAMAASVKDRVIEEELMVFRICRQGRTECGVKGKRF